MEQQEFLEGALRRYRERLTEFGRRNRELYFKESRLSLDLTSQPYSLDAIAEEDRAAFNGFQGLSCAGGGFQKILEEGSLPLTEFLLLQERLSSESELAYDTTRKAIVKTLDKIRLADSRYKREYGITGAWLLGPFLCWRSSYDAHPTELVVSPLFRIPVDLHVTKRKHWNLSLESDLLECTPSLRLFLKKSWGIELPEMFQFEAPEALPSSLIETLQSTGKEVRMSSGTLPPLLPRRRAVRNEDGEIVEYKAVSLQEELTDAHAHLYESVTADRFVVLDTFVVSQINASRMALVEDYDRILDSGCSHQIVEDLLRGDPVPNELADEADSRRLEADAEGDNYFVVNVDSRSSKRIP